MSEKAKEKLENIGKKLVNLPESVADTALDQYVNHITGLAEGFAAGKAYAEAAAEKKEVQ